MSLFIEVESVEKGCNVIVNLETIIEIGSEYQEIFEEHGGEKVQLVPSSNDHPAFVSGLVKLIRERL